ncbi:hypothetical protein [Neobacillus sp. Marseille-QA0830]
MPLNGKNQEKDLLRNWTVDTEKAPITTEDELLPEFDEIGTALNEI